MTDNRAVRFGLAAGLAFGLAMITGCQARNEPAPNQRQARLLAAQNVDLQQRMRDVQAELESLRQQCAEKLQQKNKELAGCEARNELLKKDLETGITERVAGVTDTVIQENVRLRKENNSRKTEIERLGSAVERLQGQNRRQKDEMEELKTENERLTGEIVSVKAEIERLKTESEGNQP